MKITGIDHIAIMMADMDQANKFYVEPAKQAPELSLFLLFLLNKINSTAYVRMCDS